MDQLFVYACVIMVLVIGGLMQRYTDIGLRVRVMVDSPAMTSLSGTNPKRISAGVWAVSVFFAGLGRCAVGADGQDITVWLAHRIRQDGLAYVPEGHGICPGLSVIDNMRMAVRDLRSKAERRAAIDVAFSLSRRSAASVTARRQHIRGEQQMLAMRRVLSAGRSRSLPTRCRPDWTC